MSTQWTTIKPEFKEDCICVTATWIRSDWEYAIWMIEKVDFGDGEYMAWLTGDGEEYGDLADLKADKYLIILKP